MSFAPITQALTSSVPVKYKGDGPVATDRRRRRSHKIGSRRAAEGAAREKGYARQRRCVAAREKLAIEKRQVSSTSGSSKR
jgi:hypothetical protein